MSESTLDYNKPICSTSTDGNNTYILLERTHEDSYGIKGYDWYNITANKWNSCVCWKTKEEAVSVYRNVRNCKISVEVEYE